MTAGRARMDLPQVGDELEPIKHSIGRADLVRYAGASGDFNPIHFSDAAARSAGLGGVIAHGMLTMGAAIEIVTRWAGDPGAVTGYEVRFARPVPVADGRDTELTITARVAAVDEDARTATVAITADVDGVKVLGRARATVRFA